MTTHSLAHKVYAATGSTAPVLSGCLSVSGMMGPCLAHDTACSAALVANHAALRAVQLQECDGLVTAVTLMLLPLPGTTFAVAGMS